MMSHPLSPLFPTRRRFLRCARWHLASAPRRTPSHWEKPDGDGSRHRRLRRSRLSSFDDLLTSFLKKTQIPGATAKSACPGKLVYARGFGYADVRKETVAPPPFFRIAECLQADHRGRRPAPCGKGKVGWTTRPRPPEVQAAHAPSDEVDPRLETTVSYNFSGTPAAGIGTSPFLTRSASRGRLQKSLGIKPPVKPEHIVRYMMGKPLDFDPGQRLSNLRLPPARPTYRNRLRPAYETYVREPVLALRSV